MYNGKCQRDTGLIKMLIFRVEAVSGTPLHSQCQAQWLVGGRYIQSFLNEFYKWGDAKRGNVYILEIN